MTPFFASNGPGAPIPTPIMSERSMLLSAIRLLTCSIIALITESLSP